MLCRIPGIAGGARPGARTAVHPDDIDRARAGALAAQRAQWLEALFEDIRPAKPSASATQRPAA